VGKDELTELGSHLNICQYHIPFGSGQKMTTSIVLDLEQCSVLEAEFVMHQGIQLPKKPG
jgi:hypothetical protein